MNENLYEWFMNEEFFTESHICPHCEMGRLFCVDQTGLFQCDTCDTEFHVSDHE